MDRTAESNKAKGKRNCFMTKHQWYNTRNVSTLSSSCSPHLELLSVRWCPFYLTWVHLVNLSQWSTSLPSCTGMTLETDLISVMCWMCSNTNQWMQHFVVAGDFNKATLKSYAEPLRTWYMSGEEVNILDHCYTLYKPGYKAILHSGFGKSDQHHFLYVGINKAFVVELWSRGRCNAGLPKEPRVLGLRRRHQ